MSSPIKDKKFLLLLAAVFAVLVLEVLSLAGINIPEPYAPILFGAFIIGVGYEVLWHGLKALIRLNFSSISLLMLIAVIGAFYLKEYPEAAVVIVLYVLGERLEDIGLEKSKSALDKLIANSPKSAVLKETGQAVPIEQIPVGSIVQVKPHDMIPLDGIVVVGETAVDEATITGEPIPKDKHKGDAVFAGTMNMSGFLEIQTTRLSTDTTFAKIVELTFEAQAGKSESQKFIQRFAKYYTPCVIILAVLLFVIPVFALNQDLNKWLLQAITLLVISCPCALVISTPVAIYAALGNASSKGILVKGGKYIEAMAKVKALCLDKTRTITYGNPIVSDIIPLNGTGREELLACGAGAEVFSEHPLAQAIVDAARKEGFEPHAVEKYKSIAGKGATARCLVCEDETICIGKLSYIRESQPVTEEVERLVEQLSEQGKTSVVVSFGQGVAGIIGLNDEIKPDSAGAISELKAMGVEPIMLTGDSEAAAHYVASEVGISKVYGGLMPETKATHIKQALAEYGSVAMVGDGVNDAPALAQSTVGIAMGAVGSDTAIEVANVALMNDKLSLIPYLIRLSKATTATIRGNTIAAVLVKFIFVILAVMGHGNLLMAITADVGVTLVVIAVSLRLLRFGHGK